MNGPCDCGAEDCPMCYPNIDADDSDQDDGSEPETPEPYRAMDKNNEWMDYICEGYRDATY